MFVFQIATEDTDKQAFLKILCRNVASTMCRPDPDTFLRQMRAEDLGLEPSDFNVSNFSSTYRTLQKKVSIFFTFMNFQRFRITFLNNQYGRRNVFLTGESCGK